MKEDKKNAQYDIEEINTGSVKNESFSIRDTESPQAAPGDDTQLKRHLKSRHVSMIAIGGSLGTGLLIGTASSLSTAGPAACFISYSVVGLVVYIVMTAVGEMATWVPLPDGFPGYASRFCDPALGFAVGYAYLIKYLIVTPNQLVAGSLVMKYWLPNVNSGVWITVFLVLIVCINLFGVKFFGEFEFWLSSFKVVVVLGLIILLFVLMLGGGPNHDRLGFRYWQDPGSFRPYTGISPDSTAKFVSFWSVFVYAVFAYLGTELVGVVVGEAANPRKTIPKAIKLTFYRILVFYCVSILLLGCCVAYNDPLLMSAKGSSTSSAASPFVVAIRNAGIPVLPHILNASILLFVFSASNSDLYIASRTLYGLAVNGKAPKIFARTSKQGIPIYALGLGILFCLLAYMATSSSAKEVFGYFVNVVSIMGLLTWVSILVTHLYFMKALKAQGISRKHDLVYSSPLQPYATWFALFMCILISLIKNFTAFLGETFSYKEFITGYIGIPFYLIMLFGYKIIKKTKTVDAATADLFSYKDKIDAEEEAYKLEQERLELINGPPTGLKGFYEKYIGWVF